MEEKVFTKEELKKQGRNLESIRFGRLVVKICYSDKSKVRGYSNLYWKCICDCGKEKIVRGADLISGMVRSCGCFREETFMSRKLNLEGKTFGDLVVLRRVENHKSLRAFECECKCGNKEIVVGSYLNTGKKTCCRKCLRRKKLYNLRKDLTGVCFGDWEVVKRVENKILPSGESKVRWLCRNSTGDTKEVFSTYIMSKIKEEKDYRKVSLS